MIKTYQQIITCHQLYDLLVPNVNPTQNSTKNSVNPSSNIVVLDASIPPVGNMNLPKKKWPDVALPNAQRFDLNKDFSDLSNPLPHTMPSAEHFQKQAEALGVNSDSQIVIYDDQGLFSAARAWYMFKSMGHTKVAVLNGGLPAWIASGFFVSSAKSNVDKTHRFTAKFSDDFFCDSKEVYEQLMLDEQIIVDARAAVRFEGKAAEPRKGVRSGHMPNSVNLSFTELLNDGALLSKTALKEKFQQINSQNKPMLMSCGSGVTACVLALAADICGYKEIKVYDGSWSEWGANPQLPVVTGK